MLVCFFVKQKTAYDMRISDWSSDVCSSDLRNPHAFQPHHQIFRDAVVEHALAGDRALLLVVEGGGVVLEILDQRARLGSFEQNLRLAFVDPTSPGHSGSPRDNGGSYRGGRHRRRII